MSNEKDDKTMKPTPVDESVSIVERDQSGNVTAEYREESNTIVRVHHAINSPVGDVSNLFLIECLCLLEC